MTLSGTGAPVASDIHGLPFEGGIVTAATVQRDAPRGQKFLPESQGVNGGPGAGAAQRTPAVASPEKGCAPPFSGSPPSAWP